LVALKARLVVGLVVGLVVELLIPRERRVFPFAVPDVVRILGAPARALFHDGESHQVALEEPAVAISQRVTAGVALGFVLDQREDRAAGDWLGLPGRVFGLCGCVPLPL